MDKWLNSHIMEMPGNHIIMQPIDQTRSSSLMNNEVIKFVEKNAESGKPWAVYYAFTEAHTPLIVEEEFKGRSEEHGAYGDTIIQMDALLGRVLEVLDQTGQASILNLMYSNEKCCSSTAGNLKLNPACGNPQLILDITNSFIDIINSFVDISD